MITDEFRAGIHAAGMCLCAIFAAWNFGRYCAPDGTRQHLLNASIYTGGAMWEWRQTRGHLRAM